MQGRIIRWNDERGFGFISSKDCDGDVFAHISQFRKGYRRPKVGELVDFKLELEEGKQSAKAISLVGLKPDDSILSRLKSIFFACIVFISIAYASVALLNKSDIPTPVKDAALSNSQLSTTPRLIEKGFSCQGKKHCSQMTSCAEAKYYLAHCPNVKIDGNNDGVPCERQHCSRF